MGAVGKEGWQLETVSRSCCFFGMSVGKREECYQDCSCLSSFSDGEGQGEGERERERERDS